MTAAEGTVRGGLWRRLGDIDYQHAIYRLARFNPAVSAHEFRTRMRGYRVFWILFAYTAIACAAFFITLWTVAWAAQFNQGGPGLHQTNLGRLVLSVVSYTQLTLILLIVPAYAAGAITMEREKRTLEMLRATLLSPSDVVTGKLVVVLALGLTLLLTTLPVAAWCLLLGGVAPVEIVYAYTYLFAVCLFVATLGLALSTVLGRSIGAVVVTYGLLIVIMIAFPIVVAIVEGIAQHSPTSLRFSGTGAALTLACLGALGAYLLFLALRWLWQRLLGARAAGVCAVVTMGVPILLFLYVLLPRGPFFTPLSHASLFWLLITQPYIALSGVLDGMAAQLVSGAAFRGRFGGVSGLQFYLWLVSTGLATLSAAGLWALSIRTFRLRAR